MKETNRLAPVDHGDATAQMTPGTLVSRLAVLDMAGLRRVLMYAWGACPSSVESALADDRAEQLRKAARATKPCPAPGCGHPKTSHWEHNAASGGRFGCAILGCLCARYADPAEPERSAAPVIVPCPAAVVHGPCSRLAGHPVPHRTLAGHEWDDSPCARPGCGHSERDHVFGLQPSMVTRECGDADCGCAAFEAPDAIEDVADCARPGCQHPRHHHWEFGPTTPSSPASGCDMTGCPCPSYAATFDVERCEIHERRAADLSGSQERDGSRVAR